MKVKMKTKTKMEMEMKMEVGDENYQVMEVIWEEIYLVMKVIIVEKSDDLQLRW